MDSLIKWLKDLFHADYNAIAGIIITVITFVLGLLLNEIFKAVGKYRQRITYRKILLINVTKMKSEILVRSENLKNLIQLIKVDEETNIIFKYDNIPSLEVLKNIGYENTYRAYFVGIENLRWNQNNKLEALHSLWNTVEYLNGVQKIIVSNFQEFYQEYFSMNMVRHNHTQELAAVLDEVSTAKSFPNEPDLVNFLGLLLAYRVKSIGVKVKNATTLNAFHLELKNLYINNNQVAGKYKEELKTREIIKLTMNCIDTYTLLTNLVNKTNVSLNNTLQGYLQAQNELTSIEGKFKK